MKTGKISKFFFISIFINIFLFLFTIPSIIYSLNDLNFLKELNNDGISKSPEPSNVEFLITDDFESYQVGDFPDEGGWQVVWGGQESYVTDSEYHSGSKSLMCLGNVGWSCVVEHHFNVNFDVIGFRAYAMVEDYSQNGYNVCRFGFWNRGSGWGDYTACIDFKENGQFSLDRFGLPRIYIKDFVPNKWYKITLILFKTTGKCYVWIDDELVLYNIFIPNNENIDAFVITSEWATKRTYYDDILVFGFNLNSRKNHAK